MVGSENWNVEYIQSPPWAMKPGMMRWKGHRLKPFPGVCSLQSARKLSAVLGTVSLNNSIVIRPAGCPPMVTSKYTRGFTMLRDRVCKRSVEKFGVGRLPTVRKTKR